MHRALNLSEQQPAECQQKELRWMRIRGAIYRAVRVVSALCPPPVTQPLSVPASCQQNGDMEVAERVNEGPHDKACTWWCLPMIPVIPAVRGLRWKEPEGPCVLFPVPYLVHSYKNTEGVSSHLERSLGLTEGLLEFSTRPSKMSSVCLVNIFPKPDVSAEGEGISTGGLHGTILGLTQSSHTTCPIPWASHYTACTIGVKDRYLDGSRISIYSTVGGSAYIQQ